MNTIRLNDLAIRTELWAVSVAGAVLMGTMASAVAQEPRQTILEKLNARHGIEVKAGEVPIYFSKQDATQDEVVLTQNLMTDAIRYYSRFLGPKPSPRFYGAIISKQDWEGLPITEEVQPGTFVPIPYGLPGLSDREGPHGAILGTSQPGDETENVLIVVNLQVLEALKAPAIQENLLRAGLPLDAEARLKRAGFKDFKEAARRFPLLAALHEMGHVYARTLDIAFDNHKSHTMDETLANLFLYSFLKSRPDLKQNAVLWDVIMDGYTVLECPKFQKKEEFDELYERVFSEEHGGSIMNFVYYLGMTLWMVWKLSASGEQTPGLRFVNQLRTIVRALPPTGTAQVLYKRLAAQNRNFSTWYARFNAPAACR
jgi:hypothetical protein